MTASGSLGEIGERLVNIRASEDDAKKAIAKLVDLTSEQESSADVNGDTKVTMEDVTTIQKYIAKLIPDFEGRLIVNNQ